jgi:hypothetical protein
LSTSIWGEGTAVDSDDVSDDTMDTLTVVGLAGCFVGDASEVVVDTTILVRIADSSADNTSGVGEGALNVLGSAACSTEDASDVTVDTATAAGLVDSSTGDASGVTVDTETVSGLAGCWVGEIYTDCKPSEGADPILELHFTCIVYGVPKVLVYHVEVVGEPLLLPELCASS